MVAQAVERVSQLFVSLPAVDTKKVKPGGSIRKSASVSVRVVGVPTGGVIVTICVMLLGVSAVRRKVSVIVISVQAAVIQVVVMVAPPGDSVTLGHVPPTAVHDAAKKT